MGSSVDLSHCTQSNQYVFPQDGYVSVGSERVDSGYIRVVVMGKGNIAGYLYLNISGHYQIQSLFVRKGMSAYVYENNTTGTLITYRPLIPD